MENIYYVYLYLDSRKPYSNPKYPDLTFEPFYVGRGKNKRLFAHLAEAKSLKGKAVRDCGRANMIKINKINKMLDEGYPPIIVKYQYNLTFDQCKFLERQLINEFGKIIDGSGILTNFTDGSAEGCPKKIMSGSLNPFYGKTHSDEFKAKMSIIHKGKELSANQKDAISKANTGKIRSLHAKENYRASMVDRVINYDGTDPSLNALWESRSKHWVIRDPDGNLYEIKSLSKFCLERGLKHKSLMSAFPDREISSGPCAGWRIIERKD